MQIKKMVLKNFRSFGEEGLELSLSSGTNTIIGENNIGKSSVFEALKLLKMPEVVFKKEDWHKSDQKRTILLQIECQLDSQQIQKIIDVLQLPYDENHYVEYFSNSVTYSFEKLLGLSYLRISLGPFYIENNYGFFREHERGKGYQLIAWENVSPKMKLDVGTLPPLAAFNLVAKDTISQLKKDEIIGIGFRPEVSTRIRDIIMEKIIIIDEFRERPEQIRSDVISSPSGKELASVLNKLKNARPAVSKSYDEIKKTIKHLYPNLDIEVIDEENNIRILTSKDSIESTTQYLGSGIIQTLLLLTHLIAHSDKVLCIDTPETHLHPHAQRRMGSLIETSKGSQIVLITHSQYFLDVNKKSRIFRFIQKEGETLSITPDEKFFQEEDFHTFKKILDIGTKEFIFSRKVILVEGQSEEWALPILASSLDFNFDEHGISVISVNGKDRFQFYVKLLEGFKIPWYIFVDNDAQPQIDKIKAKEGILKNAKFSEVKAIILPGELEDLFPPEIYKTALKEFNDNTSLVAKEAASIMVEKKVDIPDEIKNLINLIQ